MEELIIKDNYKKWFDFISSKNERDLVTLNWADTFQKINHILISAFTDYELKINLFIFLNKIVTMKFLTTDTEIKSYFNNIAPVLVSYTTHSNVFFIFTFLASA